MKDVEKTPVEKLPGGARVLVVVSPYYRGVAEMMLARRRCGGG
ncbi:MAG: hypothetical protein NVV62_00050 [Terricaulis sp.]|nr:hypothetical protein [Terricaulis sp.]